MKLLLKGPRGTQDVLPSDSYKWQFIEKNMMQIVSKYGFKEIRIPTFEHTDLFCRSVGDTSDIVEKEMYTFEDKSSRLITLRPEGTAGVVRSVLEHNLLNLTLPLKVAYILSCFRYEKPDSGRLREFHQFGVELFGSSSPQADFEVISMASEMIRSVGISKYTLNINSIGCKKCRANYKKALIEYMISNKDNLCDVCKDRLYKNPMRILDCKEEKCQEIVKEAPVILDFLCDECELHLKTLKEYLDKAKIYYVINSKIVRGLDYYTKTVFEFVVNINGSNLTVCGGGRYDDLVEDLGGPSTPAFGFGMGLERLIMILNNEENNIEIEDKKCDIYIITMNEKARIYSVNIVQKLRKFGYIVETDLMGRSLKAQMKYANKISARHTMVIGEDEINSGKAAIKNMKTSELKNIILNESFENILD